jgi:hypothetical protein
MNSQLSALKPLIWLLPIMLTIGFLALLTVAAHDEGMISENALVKVCLLLVSFFSFPFKHMENWKIFTGWWSVVLYFLNVTFWAISFFYLFRLFKKFL